MGSWAEVYWVDMLFRRGADSLSRGAASSAIMHNCLDDMMGEEG
jgi:hypothetical protein